MNRLILPPVFICRPVRFLVLLGGIFLLQTTNGQGSLLQTDGAERQEVVEALSDALIKRYAVPELGLEMAEALRANLSKGKYDGITSGIQFALTLRGDLLDISRDVHFNVSFNPYGAGSFRSDTARAAQNIQQAQILSRLISRVEILPGNIGYIRITGFADGEEFAGLLAGAFAFVANTQALIIDTRDNRGGDPDGVALLMSYLLDGAPRHIQSLHWHEEDGVRIDDFFTSYVGDAAYGESRPLAVLTSSLNVSGGEGFPYHVQAFKRGVVIGEKTMGGGHANRLIPLSPRFTVAMPSARAYHPVTGGDWEGTGVTPDIAVPAEEALDMAEQVLFEQLAEAEVNPGLRASQLAMAMAIEARRTNRGEPTIPVDELTGDYEPENSSLLPWTVLTDADGGLHVVYRARDGSGSATQADLVHVGGDRYRFGLFAFKSYFNFRRENDGITAVLEIHPPVPPQVEVSPRVSLYQKTSKIPSNVELQPQPVAVELPVDTLSRYTGVYGTPDGRTLTVTLVDGQLLMDFYGTEKVPMFAETDTRFFFRIMHERIEFLPDNGGEYRSMLLITEDGLEVPILKK